MSYIFIGAAIVLIVSVFCIFKTAWANAIKIRLYKWYIEKEVHIVAQLLMKLNRGPDMPTIVRELHQLYERAHWLELYTLHLGIEQGLFEKEQHTLEVLRLLVVECRRELVFMCPRQVISKEEPLEGKDILDSLSYIKEHIASAIQFEGAHAKKILEQFIFQAEEYAWMNNVAVPTTTRLEIAASKAAVMKEASRQ